MIQKNEVISLLLYVGVFIYIQLTRSQFNRLQKSQILIWGFYIYFLGRILTVLEGLFLREVLSFLEHLSYAIGSGLVFIWCWQIFGKEKEAKYESH